MKEEVLEIPVEFENGETGKIFIKAYVKLDGMGYRKHITAIDAPRILSVRERNEMGI